MSGIYPQLAMFNEEGECGTGAVVPWADRLWVITYAPHYPKGSTDKLYEITPSLEQIIRPESIGGTPANRMIHKDSGQLFIGPYAIDSDRNVRTIPYSEMFGRPTGNARHLTDPQGKILFATMEEGIYEVDVKSLEVTELWGDEAMKDSPRKAGLPGYHGKGFYSGQGVYVYANNGEHGPGARKRPDVSSGVLAEWDGVADHWKIVRRNQFTEVTGPGGIHGNSDPATDPIWAVGWDHKSLLLGLRTADEGWRFFRMPKGSHSYDGAHGWNTEWPRIRDIGEDELLMTMHGTFWKFPKDFGAGTLTGIRPRSNYLKVIGDFCRWNDRLVFGCDDTAKNEFLNKRKAKGEVAAPQSQSNLWFVEPEQLDQLGPAIGRGAVWLDEDVAAGKASDPYLFAGYPIRGLHVHHRSDKPATIFVETGDGSGEWTAEREVEVAPNGYRFVSFDRKVEGEWIRLRSETPLVGCSAVFTYRSEDSREDEADPMFAGLAKSGEAHTGGIVRARGGGMKTLSFAALGSNGKPAGYYELNAELKLKRVDDTELDEYTRNRAAIPKDVLSMDAASVIYTDDEGKRWRLPKGAAPEDGDPFSSYRIAREVATERDLLHVEGSFYELPARNAGGISKVRPVATHHRRVHDFCSYRGLFIMSGVATDAPANNPHILRSDDGKVALWAGAIDDAWKLGKPRGEGGPWADSEVKAGVPSDPYLITAYDRKSLELALAEGSATITAQIDVHGDGTWVPYESFSVSAGTSARHEFPEAFSAYWIRFVANKDCRATALLSYR
ncbi:coagulation factor 5/8 type domain-containing protein [Haloferula helveola]|uniref:Coagulation factor 5/8 type domain-containing protein n=1 Tax=Haloferula helveola TaxID=490095 RepID=A0ABM7RIM4_9BACT|nr:coagulation factor 5/8 type domain-containing protein [Haloferula helveola]